MWWFMLSALVLAASGILAALDRPRSRGEAVGLFAALGVAAAAVSYLDWPI